MESAEVKEEGEVKGEVKGEETGEVKSEAADVKVEVKGEGVIPDDAQLEEATREILKAADLESVTKKTVRRSLEAKLGVWRAWVGAACHVAGTPLWPRSCLGCHPLNRSGGLVGRNRNCGLSGKCMTESGGQGVGPAAARMRGGARGYVVRKEGRGERAGVTFAHAVCRRSWRRGARLQEERDQSVGRHFHGGAAGRGGRVTCANLFALRPAPSCFLKIAC